MSNLIFNLRLSKVHFQLNTEGKWRIVRNDSHSWLGWPLVQLHEARWGDIWAEIKRSYEIGEDDDNE